MLDNEFRMPWRVRDVMDGTSDVEIEAAARGEPLPEGVELEAFVEGHPDLVETAFVEIFSADPVEQRRAVQLRVDQMISILAVRLLRKERGPLAGKLDHLRDLTGIEEGFCGDCIKRSLGLLQQRPEETAPQIEPVVV